MIVGFTGTRRGPTPRQHESMARFLSNMPMQRFVHGGAVHCDTFAHNIVSRRRAVVIEIHPSRDSGSTMWMPRGNCEIYPELPPLERNRIIVRRVHGLLAVPFTDHETDTGTWATVRYGREIGLPIYIVQQSGRIVRDLSMDVPL